MPKTENINDFAKALSVKRGIPLCLVPVPLPSSVPCGMWLSTDHADFVVYDAETSKHHQEHIIAHELGHMICGHQGSTTGGNETYSLLFPDLNPEIVSKILHRSRYFDIQEREAETMATVILDSIRPRSLSSDSTEEMDDVLSRICGSLK